MIEWCMQERKGNQEIRKALDVDPLIGTHHLLMTRDSE